MTLQEETLELIDLIIETPKRDYLKVTEIIQRIEILLEKHSKTIQFSLMDEQVELLEDSTSLKGIELLTKHCTPFLVSVLSKPPIATATLSTTNGTTTGTTGTTTLSTTGGTTNAIDDANGTLSTTTGGTTTDATTNATTNATTGGTTNAIDDANGTLSTTTGGTTTDATTNATTGGTTNATTGGAIDDATANAIDVTNGEVWDKEELIDRVSLLISKLCGRIALGESISEFDFTNAHSLKLKETSFTEAEIGFQTWGGGILMAKYFMLIRMIDDLKIDVRGKNVLELGSGTGVTGLVSGRMGSKFTLMTDYHPVVIQNALNNIKLNNLEDKVDCKELDWRWTLKEHQSSPIYATQWDMVIAADCIFDLEHSRIVPIVSQVYLSKHEDARFHCLLPHRLQFKREVGEFEENMLKNGWILDYDHWIHKHALTFRYYIWKLPIE